MTAGRYATSAQYAQAPGSIHTPQSIGSLPVAFFGIAYGGVVLTGLPGHEGASLLEDFDIGPDRVAALLQDLATVRQDRTLGDAQSYVLRHVLLELRWRRLIGERGGWGVAQASEFVDGLIAQGPKDRIRIAADSLAAVENWLPV